MPKLDPEPATNKGLSRSRNHLLSPTRFVHDGSWGTLAGQACLALSTIVYEAALMAKKRSRKAKPHVPKTVVRLPYLDQANLAV